MPSIHDARLAVMAELPALGRDGRNEQDGYDFRSADAVIAAVRPVLLRHKVTATPTVLRVRQRVRRLAGGNGVMQTLVEVRWRFQGPERDHDDVVVWGEAADQGDKSVSKAQTVAQRVAWCQWLAIPTHEVDPDATSYQLAAPRPARQKRERRPVPPPDAGLYAQQIGQLAALLGDTAAAELWARCGGVEGEPRTSAAFRAMVRLAEKEAAARPTPDAWATTLTPTEVAGHLASYGLTSTGDLEGDRALLVLAALEEADGAAA